ncbi:protein of unassigned function [Methylobacterium oryzae CBMB20]|uniref:Protein of unassigned function n=1 Tax=Methylobacterium oryzae CBMB20 TaxID=693986 RepID=A0A089NP61_9HYPH|nr:protein of unassigned function [Methylobacterium oryzae CBMB20]
MGADAEGIEGIGVEDIRAVWAHDFRLDFDMSKYKIYRKPDARKAPASDPRGSHPGRTVPATHGLRIPPVPLVRQVSDRMTAPAPPCAPDAARQLPPMTRSEPRASTAPARRAADGCRAS